jgi:sugar lactone lactonase YvrE
LEVDPRTGAHALIAGSNRFGYAGSTDGPGASARFREPRGIACTQDRLYVADRGNGVVRTIDLKDHHVQTLAGRVDTFGVRDGASDGARFDDAQGILAWGEALYVGDTASLRTVSTHDGRVRTVAGTPEESGAASEGVTGEVLSRPAGVAVVASEGAAYVADCRSSSIRRVDLTTHHISVFAGDISPLVGDMLLTRFVDGPWDKARFNCAASIVYDGLGNLFVGDHYNHAVRAIHLATQRVVTVAGDPNRCGNEDGPFETATFCEPSSLAFGDGALFVADASASTIRRVDLRVDAVSTLAGKPFVRGWADGQGREARFAAPSSIVYCDGALWVADALNHVVRRVDVRSGVVDTLAGAAGHAGNVDGDFAQTRFDTPRALVCTGADELFVFDRVSVRRLSLSRRISAHVLDSGRGLRTGDVMPQLAEPVAAIGLEPGALLVVDRTENVVVRLLYPQ